MTPACLLLSPANMAGAKRFEDLIAWQRSEALKDRVLELLEGDSVKKDRDFCDDIRRSARSAPANIAEGFGWYDPKPNKRHVSIAKASLDETRNHILEGFKRRHFSETDRDELLNLQKRAMVATRRYLLYLRSCNAAPEPKPKDRRNNQNRQNPQNPQNLEPPEPEPLEPLEPLEPPEP